MSVFDRHRCDDDDEDDEDVSRTQVSLSDAGQLKQRASYIGNMRLFFSTSVLLKHITNDVINIIMS